MRNTTTTRLHCDCGASAECTIHESTMNVADGPHVRQNARRIFDTKAIGWSMRLVHPSGIALTGRDAEPAITDTDAAIATKLGVPQHTFECPACAEKTRARQVVEGAGVVVTR